GQQVLDGRVPAGVLALVPVGAVEDGRGDEGGGRRRGAGLRLRAPDRRASHGAARAVDVPAPTGDVTQVRFEHLAHVHPARYAERIEDDVDGRAIGQERHVLD